eukprot:2807083-Pyramimonas_sp.AAC.1
MTPRSWSVPPECDTEEAVKCTGDSMHSGRIVTEDGTPIAAHGDWSGSKCSTDLRCRRCDWAWISLGGVDMATAAGKHGPLPGRRQTNNRV